MEIITHDIDLDFADSDSMITIHAKQDDDEGRAIRVSLYYNGERLTIDTSQGDVARIHASTNGYVTVESQRVTIYQNQVLIPITAEMSQFAGLGWCEVSIAGVDGTVHSARFNIFYGANAGKGESLVPAPVGMKIVKCTQAEYDAMSTHDANTLYVIVG